MITGWVIVGRAEAGLIVSPELSRVSRPIWLPRASVNQRLPSGPAMIPPGTLLAVGTANSVIAPEGVIRPIWLLRASVNQRLPSGPALMTAGTLPDVRIDWRIDVKVGGKVGGKIGGKGIGGKEIGGVGSANSVMLPAVVIRPIRLPPASVNQRLPSGPVVIAMGVGNWLVLAAGIANSWIELLGLLGLIRPIWLPRASVNQRLPSGPAVIPTGPVVVVLAALGEEGVGSANSVMMPAVVIRPIWLPSDSVNQRLPSGPAAIPAGMLLAVGSANSVMMPAVVIRPIWLLPASANQRLPSGPAVMPTGMLSGVGIANSVITPPGVIRPILSPNPSVNQRLPSGPTVITVGMLLDVGIAGMLLPEGIATSPMAPTLILKLIVSVPGVVLALRIAWRNEPGPLSALLVTVSVASSTRSSTNSKERLTGRFRPRL